MVWPRSWLTTALAVGTRCCSASLATAWWPSIPHAYAGEGTHATARTIAAATPTSRNCVRCPKIISFFLSPKRPTLPPRLSVEPPNPVVRMSVRQKKRIAVQSARLLPFTPPEGNMLDQSPPLCPQCSSPRIIRKGTFRQRSLFICLACAHAFERAVDLKSSDEKDPRVSEAPSAVAVPRRRWHELLSTARSHMPPSPVSFAIGVAVGIVLALSSPTRSVFRTPQTPPPAVGSAQASRNPLTTPLTARGSSPLQVDSNTKGVTVPVAGPREPVPTAATGRTYRLVTRSSPARRIPARVASAPRAARPNAPRYRGALAVNSRPNGASVFVNNRPVGRTPLVLNDMPTGSRVVRVELKGYRRWSSAVSVVANQRTRALAALQPLSN